MDPPTQDTVDDVIKMFQVPSHVQLHRWVDNAGGRSLGDETYQIWSFYSLCWIATLAKEVLNLDIPE